MQVLVMELYIGQRGIARRSGYFATRAGKISPCTIDFGFLKALILPATWYGSKVGSRLGLVMGISCDSRDRNSLLIALKCSAKSSATSPSDFPGKRSATLNGFCLS